MKIYLYDFFNSSTGDRWLGVGNEAVSPPYWIEDISGELNQTLERIECNNWRGTDFVGGMKTCGGNVCVFRLFNGGFDWKDRGNRWVMLALEGSREEFRATNLWEALSCEVFRKYAEKIVPAKALLPEAFPRWHLRESVGTSFIPEEKYCSGAGAKAFVEKYSLALSSSEKTDGSLYIENVGGEVRAWLKSTPEREVPPPREKNSEKIGSFEYTEPKVEPPPIRTPLRPTQRRTSPPAKVIVGGCAAIGLIALIGSGMCVKCVWEWFPQEETRYAVCGKEKTLIIVHDFPKEATMQVSKVCPICGEEHAWQPVAEVKSYTFSDFARESENK